MSCHWGVCLFLLVGMLVALFPHHCKGNTCSWEVSEDLNANPQEILNGITSLNACQERCDERPDCVAVTHASPVCCIFTSIPVLEVSPDWTYAQKICTNETLTSLTSQATRSSAHTTTTTKPTTITTTTRTTTTPSVLPTPSFGRTSTKPALISTKKQSTEDSASNESSGVPVAVIAGVVGAAVALVIAVIIVVFVVIRKKRGKPPHPGHPAVSNTENRGHRMANVTDNRNTTDGVTPAAEHHRAGDRDPTSTTENVYEITEENGHYYEPLSHRDNTYINDDTLYSNPVFTNREEGGGRSEFNSVSGGNTTYYNTGVQTKVNCNDNTTYHNMG